MTPMSSSGPSFTVDRYGSVFEGRVVNGELVMVRTRKAKQPTREYVREVIRALRAVR